MKQKLLFFLCSGFLISSIVSLPGNHRKSLNAESFTAEYRDNAYQICDIQLSLDNFVMYDSFYSPSSQYCLLKNSLRLRNPAQDYDNITIALEFSESAECILGSGSLNLYFLRDDGSTLDSITTLLPNEDAINTSTGHKCSIKGKMFMVEIDTYSFPQYFTLAGEEYSSQGKAFRLDFGKSAKENNYIERFMVFPGEMEHYYYVAPQVGKGANSDKVYYNGSTYDLEMDYDKRLTVDDILSSVIAYDYGDNKEITKYVENDNYTQALTDNVLGNYSFDVVASDSNKNKSVLTILVNIKDKTAPIITGEDKITISYTALDENKNLDVSSYFSVSDNYDKNLSIKNNKITLKDIKDYEILIKAEDASGNVGSKTVRISVIDDVLPTIEGQDEFEFYQFELDSGDEILSQLHFSDGEGSGIVSYGFSDGFSNDILKKVGTYEKEVYATDKFGNTAKKKINIVIKDGIGPVFFINAKSISVTTSSLLTSDDIKELMISSGNIPNKNYKSTSFMDNNYIDNYNSPGSYETQIVCYQEDGSRDFYKVTINVKKVKEKNVFVRFLSLLKEFFEKIGKFFEYIWNLFLLRL